MTTKTEILRTIKSHCTECCGGSEYEAKLCTCKECHLYAFRTGKDTLAVKRVLSEEEKQVLRERLKRVRLASNSPEILGDEEATS